jgi:uridine kinase
VWIINIDGMTKPVITLGIAGGTGAGKVRLHFKRKQLVA